MGICSRQILQGVSVWFGLSWRGAVVQMLLVSAAFAAGTVQLELVGESRGGMALVFQEWSRALGEAGITGVRIRAAEGLLKPSLEVQGTADRPQYVVIGVIRSREELELPGKRFRRHELAQLAAWLKDLAEHGPAERREKIGPFGLSHTQFVRLQKELASSVGFKTQNLSRREVVARLAGQLTPPLKLDPALLTVLGEEKLEEDLSDLSLGTALAYVLRQVEYGLVPQANEPSPRVAILPIRPGEETWPVGREADDSARELLPGLFEFHNVNVQNVPIAEVLKAIGRELAAPILFDHRAIKRQRIDLNTTKVSHPRSRTTYSLALRKMLFQARLKFEVRCDEAGKPFLWVSTIKKADL